MTEELEKNIKEFAQIAESCPESLREKCFEVLLSTYLASQGGEGGAGRPPLTGGEGQAGEEGAGAVLQEELTASDLHMKAKRFLQQNDLTLEHLNQLFYKEAEQILPLYDDLRTTTMAECQVRVALMHALVRALSTGEFDFDGEEVRKECEQRKCYDMPNFAKNFKNNANLFDNFEKYSKKNPVVRLSGEGRKKLADLAKELQ